MPARDIDYPGLVEQALRGFVRDLLIRVGEEGLPGEHHLYLTFSTRHPGVQLPPRMYDLYPEEMTIVLQHQFWDLVVEADAFGVTLHFGGQKQRLHIPFAALTTVVDPAAEFGLQLDLADSNDTDGVEEPPDVAPAEDERQGGEVVSMDRFRGQSVKPRPRRPDREN